MFNIATVFPDTCEAIINNGALELLESLLTNEKNHYALRESGCLLLSGICQMKPHIPPDKVIPCSIFPLKPVITYRCLIYVLNFGQRAIVLRTLKIAIFYESVSILVPACLALSYFTNQRFVDIGTEVYKRLLDLAG